MTRSTPDPDIAGMRRLLTDAFDAEDLRRFCMDRPALRPIVNQFGPRFGLDDMVDEVIEYCRKHGLWKELEAAVEEARPRRWQRYIESPKLSPQPMPDPEPSSEKPSLLTTIRSPERRLPRILVAMLALIAMIALCVVAVWLVSEKFPPSEPTVTATQAAVKPKDTAAPAATEITTTSPALAGEPPSCDANAMGKEWKRLQDDMVMVCVPAGKFWMGTNQSDTPYDNEWPQNEIHLDSFWIDKHEVTNLQYRKCVEAGACDEPACSTRPEYFVDNLPVVCVTWQGAQDYAAWVGGRLPTEAEWEKACRGTDKRVYPWGDATPTCDKANYGPCPGDSQLPVTARPAGASPYGVLDMAGNVQEWAADWYSAAYYRVGQPKQNPEGPENVSPQWRVLRGGSFESAYGDEQTRCAFRSFSGPGQDRIDFGFRVVMDDPSEP
jgi:formylglycine-generating enzyme required for sulfatase activity